MEISPPIAHMYELGRIQLVKWSGGGGWENAHAKRKKMKSKTITCLLTAFHKSQDTPRTFLYALFFSSFFFIFFCVACVSLLAFFAAQLRRLLRLTSSFAAL